MVGHGKSGGITERSKMRNKIELIEGQYGAYTSDKPYIATICGKQSGKTFLGALWTGKQLQEKPGVAGVIIAPTYKILRQATLRTFFEVFPEYKRYWKKGESVMEVPCGTDEDGQPLMSTIYIRSGRS